MTEKREKRVDQTLGLLEAWTGIGVYARLLCVIAIIAAFLWTIKTGVEVVLWLRLLG
jgi:hypothetical protein